MPLKSAKTFKEEEYWANLYGETIATPTASLPPATPEPEPEEEMGNFTRGLNMAVEEAQGLAGGVKALVGSSIGNDEWVDSGMEIYQRNMAEAKQYAGDVEKIEDINWDAEKAGKWMAHTIGRFLPDIGMAVVSGGIGGAVTKKVVGSGAKALAENKLQDQATAALIQKGIEKKAAEYISKEMGERYVKDAVGKAAFRGSVAGAAAYTGQQSAGGSFARILEETGVEAPLTALGVGIISGGLEAAPFMRVFSSMFPKGKAKEFGEFIAGDLATKPPWMTSALIDVRDIMGINAVTEGLQLIVDDSAVTYVNNNFSKNEAQEYANYLMDPEARSRMANTLAVGALMGVTTGAGTVAVKGARGDYSNPQFDDQANQTRTESNNNPSQRQEILRIFNEHRNKAKSLTGGPAPFDPVSGKKATVWDGNGALNPETNQPYTPEDYTQAGVPLPPRPLDVEGDAGFLDENEPLTPEQRQEAGLSELTDYDGKYIDVPQDIPEVTEPAPVVPESAPVVEAPQQPMFAEDSLPPSPEAPQADIVTDFAPANPEFGTTEVPARSTESGTVYEYHNFEGQLSDPAKPVTDQLVELSVAASTSEALDPTNTDVVVEAIDVDDVDRIFDRNDSQIVETEDKPTGKSLPTIGESFGENAQEATNLVAGVMADLSASGVPKSFLDSVTGMYVHTSSDHDVPAMTGQNKRGISLNSSLVSGSLSDPKQLGELAWSMTHEVYHAADFAMGLSDKDAQFNITIDESAQTPNVVMGDVMQELFTNWAEGTDLGRRFDYPFNDLREEISDRDKNNAGLNQTYRQEVFAQLGAMFHSNPKLLQEQSPLAYNYIKGIRDSNLQQPQTQESPNEISGSPVQADTSQPEGISGQVRAPPESGSVESAPVADTGSDGEGSTGVGRTDSTVEGQAQEEAGQRERPTVQEPEVKVLTVSEQTERGNRLYTAAQGDLGTKNGYYTERNRKNFVAGYRDGYQNKNGLSYKLDDNSDSRGGIYSGGYLSGSIDLRRETVGSSWRPIKIKSTEDTPVTINLSAKKPAFKKAENWEGTGTLTVTFSDGDRYQVYFDEDAADAEFGALPNDRNSGGEGVYYQSIDGKIFDDYLGTTKKEALQTIIDHREKLFAEGKNSFNTPLDPQVSSDTSFKAYNLITDHPEGKLELTKVRKKFKRLEDNQFDQMIADLIEKEGFSLEDGVLSDPEAVEERLAEERYLAEEAEFDRIAKEESRQAEEEARLDEGVSQLDIEDDLSFIKKGAEYLLEKSEGEVPSKKFVPVKSLTAKTDAKKNLAMVDEIISNHPNVLDSPEAWLAFERELTGSNTTIAPPYGLIKLVNNPKGWAKKHSTLTPQQIEAADRGLATAKRMGALYESGAADSEATGKLLLWGIMSRMLTTSAQEAGFVDLLTNSTAVTDLINKALTGSFTDKTVTRMVEVPKTKKKPKHMAEKTFNEDIAKWRDFVQEAIPQGSFGRSGTSNANDFGTLMMKMSKLDDNGVSKLQRLHDLMADRSVPSAQVRREFQAMVQGSGIDNKVFSFVQLMMGRNDVVILDRIQLNSMWDSDRYGKNIYDDIADEFGALRGAARYEAIENALKSKIKELYTNLERPNDASVGRYHWESWVRDSGQVVAHPTMKGLEKDIKGKKSPYALLGAPEGKMNTYAYSAIYARDEAGDPYYVYPNSKGTFFKFDLDKWLSFKKEISKPKNGIVDKNFKVSDFDKGIPWYESDQVNRQKLDELIESYAKRKALADEYGAEGAIAGDDPNGFRRKRIYDRLRSSKPSDSSGSQNETEISRRFGERPSRRTQVLVAGKSLPAYKRTLTPQAKKDLGLSDSYSGNIFELVPSKESSELFASRMQSSKDASKFGAAVDVHSPEKYQGMDLIITEDGTAGMASDGEYMASLFSDGTNKNVTYALLSLAIENGGKTADAFDTILPSIYQDLGLKVVSRLKWDDSQAPDGWDKKTFKRYNNGEPDLVFLKHDPLYFDEYRNSDGYYVDTYDEGLASLADRSVEEVSFIKKKKNNAKNKTLDDGSPSTFQFTYNDEIDAQSDLGRRFRSGRNATVRKLSDRYDDQKQFEDQAAEYLEVGRIPASLSPRDQENLSHGRVQEDLDKFHADYVDPIGDLINESGIDPESVGLYLLAKHAEERNAHIAEKEKAQRKKLIERTEKEIEKLEADVDVDHTVAIETQKEKLVQYQTLPFKFTDTGSGMTNAEAQSVLNTAEREGTKDAMEKISSKVYEMLQYQRDRMVEAGLLDEVSKADWEDKFKFYVPLKGFAAEEKGDSYIRGSQSRGFSVVGSESMKAKGRKTLPVNPLLTAIEDVQKKIVRARKNETAQTLLDLLSKLGESESYTIYNNKFRPPMESDPLTMQDLKSMSRDKRPNGDAKYVEVKKGGQTFFIYFKSDSLNHSLQNMSVPMLSHGNDDIGKLLTFATRFQTFRRNMLINYNPSWGLVNPARDIMTGLMYALAEMDKKGSRVQGKNIISKMAKGYIPSIRALFRYYRGAPVREGNKLDQYTKEFHEDGAQTGLMLVKDQAEQLRILKSKLKKGFTKDAIKSLAKLVEDFNMTMENSVRLAAYVESRKVGAPREDAATLSKDLTVNFNRKGEDTSVINALYLFFNAAVQGNVNIMQALGNDGSSGKKTTTAQKTAMGLVALGASLALINILNSEDDDDGDKKYSDIPEHAKNRTLLVMGVEGEEGFALPAPYGYNFFSNLGRYGAELAMGIITPSEMAVNIWDNILLNFVPITASQGDGWAEEVRGFYPDILELHQDLLTNKNYFGSEIAVEQNPLFVERSQSYVAKRGTARPFKDVARFMNDATGGDEFEDGLLSFSPDRMQYVYTYLLGGFGRSVSQSGDVLSKMARDEEVRKQDMPVISTFFKRPSEYEDRFEYYDNWQEVRQMKTQITETTDPSEMQKLQVKFKPFVTRLKGETLPVLQSKNIPNLYDLSNKKLIEIRKRRKQLEKLPETLITNEARDRKLESLEQEEQKVFDIFNKAYRKAEKQMK